MMKLCLKIVNTQRSYAEHKPSHLKEIASYTTEKNNDKQVLQILSLNCKYHNNQKMKIDY